MTGTLKTRIRFTDPDLILWLPFIEGPGGFPSDWSRYRGFNDLSGSDFFAVDPAFDETVDNGPMAGMDHVSYQPGQAGGGTKRILIGSNEILDEGDNFTFSMWLSTFSRSGSGSTPNDARDTNDKIIDKAKTAGEDADYLVTYRGASTGQVQFLTEQNDTLSMLQSATGIKKTFPLASFIHVGITWDASASGARKIYINGVLDASDTTGSSQSLTFNTKLSIMNENQEGANDSFDGNTLDFRMYNVTKPDWFMWHLYQERFHEFVYNRHFAHPLFSSASGTPLVVVPPTTVYSAVNLNSA